jgi:hypothetical protein
MFERRRSRRQISGTPTPGMPPAVYVERAEFLWDVARCDTSLDTGLLTTSFIETSFRMTSENRQVYVS